MSRAGPLAGIRVVEFAGIGPGPLAGMLLADLGAEVIRLDRVEPSGLGIERPPQFDLMLRGKRTLKVDLKKPEGVSLARALVAKADALIEGFRPQTMERIGLGPDVCLMDNPRLVYGRVTGFGQDGPLSLAAGHDINYIALTGALHAIGRANGEPTPPLNLLGDYAGGTMFLVFGMVSAMLHARISGHGQVVDAAMVEGVNALMAPFHGLHAAGIHDGARGTNLLDSGAPYYDVYRCADGEYISIAPIEKKFRSVLVDKLRAAGANVEGLPDFDDRCAWPQLRSRFTAIFAQRTRDEWCAALEGSDACFAPVLSPKEAAQHAHQQSRGAFIDVDGVTQPAPAPRFSRTPAGRPAAPGRDGDAREWARAWGVDIQ
ncbi:MAG TPA: CaiB/BaiF CoA-transferase family protein [Ramlibacter sp.]|nr:CaiB/BaiF CoA-transferase family protein [Ramlibacter sp.]